MEAAQKVIEQRVKAKTLLFKKGQRVWSDGSNLWIPDVNWKLKAKHEGPFEIMKVMESMNSTFCRNGAFTQSSTPPFCPHTMKRKNTDRTIPDLCPTF